VMGLLLAFIIFIVISIRLSINIAAPEVEESIVQELKREQVGKDHYRCGNNWLKKNEFGLWEMYVEGDAFSRGVIQGVLCKDLIYRQEKAFVNRIGEMIPSGNYQKFMKYFVGVFNRKLENYIPDEYLKEIYGISLYASEEFDFIGPNYLRILNYHAAHDIGHAIQNMNLVACTAFGTWGSLSCDSSMFIGRNFDFYVGDEFNEEKIVAFINPDEGYKFMMITWGGMIGVVSGMNENGITVSLNAAKSSIPWGAKTPVSIIARDVLQYAATIDDAYEIISKYESFVSESFLIASSIDGKAVVIEKTPEITAVYDPDDTYISQTNHFQSEELIREELNIENLENETSLYRLERTNQLILANDSIDQEVCAGILRNQLGIDDKTLGMGNEKLVNQLIAHHSIIFEPYSRMAWVSTNPFQLGAYLNYPLINIFTNPAKYDTSLVFDPGLSILPDPFLFSDSYLDFKFYRSFSERITSAIDNEEDLILDSKSIDLYIFSNKDLYNTYWILGKYYEYIKDYPEAIKYYKLALKKEIASMHERELIQESVERCNNEMI